MAKIRKAVDTANKTVQFEIRENAHSVSLFFNPQVTNTNNIVAEVQLVSKNKGNEILYSVKLDDLRKVLKGFFPSLNNTLPFSIGQNLKLSDDNYLLITLKWTNEQVTSFEYAINTVVQNTESPIIIKETSVNGDLNLDTEFYPLLLIDGGVEEYETVVMVDDSGVLTPRKIFMNRNLIISLIENGDFFLHNAVTKDQKVKIKGTSIKVYLLNV